MPEFIQCHINENHVFLSPVVGTFYRKKLQAHIPQNQLYIGFVKRLDQIILLTIDKSVCSEHSVRYDIPDGTWLNVGDIIGHIDLSIKPEVSDSILPSDNLVIVSPADGFIIQNDLSGKPFKTTGDTLHPGDIIAIVEFMKVRIELSFDGPDNCTFIHYTGHSQRPVKRGESIAIYKVFPE